MKNIKQCKVVYTTGLAGEDWNAIYINGKVVKQGENLSASDLFNALTEGEYIHLPKIQEFEVDGNWIQDKRMEKLPKSFDKIPKRVMFKR